MECCEDSERVVVDYANDLDASVYGTGFAHALQGVPRSPWDLNQLIDDPANVLRVLSAALPGVTRPWLYLGSLFSTFCWHAEDHNLYSLNLLHSGAAKTWYCVRGADSAMFQRALRQAVPSAFKEDPDLVHNLTTLLPPSVCVSSGLDTAHTVQTAGEYIVTFPGAFHAGFSHGINCAEAVNVADVSWLAMGRQAVEGYRAGPSRRAETFSHEKLVWDLTRCCRGLNDSVRVPSHEHAAVFAEAAIILKEQLRLREWLRGYGVRTLDDANPVASRECADSDECYLCGSVPFLAAVRCTCKRGLACLHHGAQRISCLALLSSSHSNVSFYAVRLPRNFWHQRQNARNRSSGQRAA